MFSLHCFGKAGYIWVCFHNKHSHSANARDLCDHWITTVKGCKWCHGEDYHVTIPVLCYFLLLPSTLIVGNFLSVILIHRKTIRKTQLRIAHFYASSLPKISTLIIWPICAMFCHSGGASWGAYITVTIACFGGIVGIFPMWTLLNVRFVRPNFFWFKRQLRNSLETTVMKALASFCSSKAFNFLKESIA